MTSASSQTPFRSADLGTLGVIPWSGETPDGDTPYLLAYSRGDGPSGPDASSAAIEQLLLGSGLRIGDELVASTDRPSLPIRLLVEAGQAVVSMPNLTAQCSPPPEWLAAVAERGYAHLVFTTRPWPEGEPGKPVDPEAFAAFAGAEETLKSAAHVVLAARGLHG
ncbi:DUF5949 family protein [Streptomyces gilvus]|uniref:DUF5949 family protein n=1 Tax=Streptomyces gilvus TaxID=2920937 RepID=UPI001F10BC25|nr:DUF5949 family protein [Streptomyces sp. CME 23]MCH5671526.1 DUF5949 family protein [Streptomyces sp. CME 23]